MSLPLRPFRFGVQASSAPDAKAWTELARRVEGNGFSTLTMPDHFGNQLAPLPALTVAAAATTTLRVGGLVWDNDFKHPLVFAKEMATLDVLSEGRVEIGIGAGWMVADYDQSGIPFDPPSVRVDRFAEAITIISGLLSGGPVSFAGEHYTITAAQGMPRPVQSPRPPILIGGGGPRVLRIAARHADIVGISATLPGGALSPAAIATMSAEAVDAKVDIVRREAGERMRDIEMNVRAFVVDVTDDPDALGRFDRMMGQPASPDLIARSPFALIGPVGKIVDDLLERRERWGISYVVVGANEIDTFAPVVAALDGR